MRLLIVDHYYSAFVGQLYQLHTALAKRSFQDQRRIIDGALFGETVFEVDALRRLGHEAWDALVNVRPLQAAWAAEHGVALSAPRHGVRWRRGLVPWPARIDDRWMGEVLLAQIRELRPDVVHIQCMDGLRPGIAAEIHDRVRLVTGQIAARLPGWWRPEPYELIVSSIPMMVETFRRQGLDAEWLPLAFEPRILDSVASLAPTERDIPVSFVGSITAQHPDRVALLEAVARTAPVAIWTADASSLGSPSRLESEVRGTAWGREMYEVLGRSRIALNHHGTIAGHDANNLRLYEATGMGALLITEQRRNLGELFEVGRQAVAYRDAEDCARLVSYYLAHPSEASAIAASGQARTLRDHTWKHRMERLVGFIEDRLHSPRRR